MADGLTTTLDRSEEMEAAFKKICMDVDGVDHFYDHLPETLKPNSVVMYFDFEGQDEYATGNITDNTLEYAVSIYVHGLSRDQLQKRLKKIQLGIQKGLRKNSNLDRSVKRHRIENGPLPRPVRRGQEKPGLMKTMRLIGLFQDQSA